MRKPPQNTQEMLPGYRDYQKERTKALADQHDRLMNLWKAGLSGERLFTARMLIYCGLPLNDTKSMEPVVRKAQLGDRSWVKVSFIRTNNLVPLPHRADRTIVYFLTNKAVLQQSPLLRWEHANEYMRLFGMNPDSGKNYRDVQERFTRVAYMDIMVEHLDANGKVVEHWKCPMIDHARISAEIYGEGKWKPSQSISKMLDAEQSVSFGLRFFAELQKEPVPIPIEIILAAGKNYRLMDYMIFLYWRAFAALSGSFIPWRYLQGQFDNQDSNPWRWPQNFRKAYRALKVLPDPINQIRADISSAGITIYPLPVGTTFFEGKPKLGYRKEQAALETE
jgi:Plasmid encoded RepA protein